MDLGILKNLELIPQILEMNKLMAERMAKFAPPLTSKKEVARFLNKSESWVNKKIQDGELREGYHFNRKKGKVLVFIEDAVLEFRDELSRRIA